MRILVVDDERSFGSLLGRALKKLGHTPELSDHGHDALRRFREGEFDAVITDIDMPDMSGVELAQAIRAECQTIPIAFCNGSAPPEPVVAAALSIGRMLPKVWTVTDVKELVADLRQTRRRLAHGSQSDQLSRHSLSSQSPYTLPVRNEPPPKPAPRRRVPKKIKVTCRSWKQVAKLCDEQSQGAHKIILRGDHPLRRGDKLFVALSLPDELVLSIASEVSAVVTDALDGQRTYTISMVGLSPELCTRLRTMCNQATTNAARSSTTYRARRNRRATAKETPPRTSPSGRGGAVIGNLRLRRQIDDLSKKLN